MPSKYSKETPYVPKPVFHGSTGNSKIGNILNINLIAGDDGINGRTTEDGSCTGCCDSCKDYCYARKSYRYDAAIEAHADNTFFARSNMKGFFEEAQKWANSKKKAEYLRWHSHGEILNYNYFSKIAEMANNLSDKTHYIYTKRYDIVNEYSKKNKLPENLSVLFSPPFTCSTLKEINEWSKENNPNNYPLFIYDNHTDPEIAKLPHCPAVDKKGHKTGVTCLKCKRCPKGLTTAVYEH